MTKTSNGNPWHVVFQCTMTIAAIILFIIGIRLISNTNGTMRERLSTETNTLKTDSTITDKTEKDSAGSKVKTTRETKKEYKVSGAGPSADSACPECLTEIHETATNYFILGSSLLALAFFLPRVTSFKFKDLSLEIQALTEKVEQAKSEIVESTNTVVSSNVGSGGKMSTQSKEDKLAKGFSPGSQYPDDPQKGKWGAKDFANNRKISAVVQPIAGTPFFQVNIKVESTNAVKPLRGKVEFHLHPTFANPNPSILVNNGVAELKLTAWGAFTLGAVADEGQTKLELDLSSDTVDAPEEFKNL